MVKTQVDLTKKEDEIAVKIKRIYNLPGKPDAIQKALVLISKSGILEEEEAKRKKLESE